ncbi:MAG: ABC transporter ATP-binding protein, partial [Clostridia bacterium]|nr:ABC transporter ATP-binding protein [Clostridia bacterium]
MSIKGQGKLLARVLKIIMKNYGVHFIVVLACILATALCTLQGTLFTEELIDVYISGIIAGTKTFADLGARLLRLAGILAIGVACSYIQQRIMVLVTQGTMLKIRNDLFTHMESLPIKYFDTHSHGDIMSVYTNDVDTMRMLIGQSLTQLVNSSVTLVTTFVSMVMLSPIMTVLSIILVSLTMLVSGKLVSRCGKFFVAQQENLGKLNGYIEEMTTGQKVVKVFCHEEKALEDFNALNESLRSAAHEANRWSNTLGPINNNLGHISYVICSMVGAALAILSGNTLMTLGKLVTYLTLNRNFTQPITQVTQQMNAIIMALAGARRVFDLMDAEPEKDDGYVELVNAHEDENGNLVESDKRTGMWAWKHPHQDGTTTLTKLEGGVTFTDVDFGYTDEKQVLHDINMYAMPGQKIAFVGGTGAGKTTITNLINRFYDIQDGKIRYDGIN